jgi:hypothetical protein
MPGLSPSKPGFYTGSKGEGDAEAAVLAPVLRGETLNTSQTRAARRVLARSEPLLRLAEQAAARSRCDFQRP